MKKKINWYVEVPRTAEGEETHPIYWKIVWAEDGSEQDEMYRKEIVRCLNGEIIPASCWYEPFSSVQDCAKFIERNIKKWERCEGDGSDQQSPKFLEKFLAKPLDNRRRVCYTIAVLRNSVF